METSRGRPGRFHPLSLLIALLISGCSGGSGSGGSSTVTGPTTSAEAPAGNGRSVEVNANRRPTISSLLVFFDREMPCETSAGEGIVYVPVFRFRDADGNVRGGRADVALRLNPSGPSLRFVVRVPSAPTEANPFGAEIRGSTSGTVAVGPVCITFGSFVGSSLSVSVLLFDRAGARSNLLTGTFRQPPGVPEFQQGKKEQGQMDPIPAPDADRSLKRSLQ